MLQSQPKGTVFEKIWCSVGWVWTLSVKKSLKSKSFVYQELLEMGKSIELWNGHIWQDEKYSLGWLLCVKPILKTRMWWPLEKLSKKPLGPQILSHSTLPPDISIILCKQLFEVISTAPATHRHDNYSEGFRLIWAPLLFKYSINMMSSGKHPHETRYLFNSTNAHSSEMRAKRSLCFGLSHFAGFGSKNHTTRVNSDITPHLWSQTDSTKVQWL